MYENLAFFGREKKHMVQVTFLFSSRLRIFLSSTQIFVCDRGFQSLFVILYTKLIV